ncbi:putative C6 transcription factor [Aspergillus ambiguus]|uniref:putative C6 transcription factor n=1 Tax=Aspergillus ambiguus TaxID=176160 RepID=UPI003CCE1DC7
MFTERRRKRPRPSYSCVECARRKLRCSKNIPCSACVERGISQLCRRRADNAAKVSPRTDGDRTTRSDLRHRETSTSAPRSGTSSNNISSSPPPVQIHTTGQVQGTDHIYPEQPTVAQTPVHLPQTSQPRRSIVDNVTEDAAVMLEFLALSRKRVLQIAEIEQSQSTQRSNSALETFDPVFTADQVRAMMSYHQKYISWIHNVVHLPTFREECERHFTNPAEVQGGWLSLYYAMLAVTLYHTDPSILQELNINSSTLMAELCYQKSMDTLHDADFMFNHNLSSIQAICLLIYVGHNVGHSDKMSVLLSCGVRMAQCLCLHRLGHEGRVEKEGEGEADVCIQRRLIDREVSKRVWWFLVRQDWLQIPFNNTYTIHPTQFNTPMPKNCDEDCPAMFESNQIIEHGQEHYTQGSYTTVLNHVAILIWRTQDKMCQQGHPNQVEDGLRKLYSEVIQADRDLRELMERMPSFFQMNSNPVTGLPAHVKYQREVLSLGLAHKFYSIHRHFHIPSFKEPWFAYTKISCFPIMRQSLASITSLPDEPYSWIVRNMWTVNTHVLTATIWLLFELIFTKDGDPSLFDGREIRDLASRSSSFLQSNKGQSRIAKRGVSLINSLLETYESIERGDRKQFDLKHIMSRVERHDDCADADSGELIPDLLNRGSVVDWLSRDSATWENILDVLGNF